MAWYFFIAFLLHNLEEAIWLPKWSQNAGKFHQKISPLSFRFAVVLITLLGLLISLSYCFYNTVFFQNLFFGFVLMMMLNVFFPHLIATVLLKKYAPGLLTGLLLILPIGFLILKEHVISSNHFLIIAVYSFVLALIFIVLIKFLFKIGDQIFKHYSK